MRSAAKYFARVIIFIIVGAIVALFLSSCSMQSIPEKDPCMCDTLLIAKVDTTLIRPENIPLKRSIKMTSAEKKSVAIAIIAVVLIMNIN